MEYVLLTAENPEELEDQVNELLRDGWKLYGDVVITSCAYVLLWLFPRTEHRYAQAMVTEKAAPEPQD
jgi:hypothetical protein